MLEPVVARLHARFASLLGLAGLTAILVAGVGLDGTSHFPATALVPVAGTCALIAAGTASFGFASRLLALRPITWVGDLSYSWYLWHWPFVVFGQALLPGARGVGAAAAAVSLLPSWASYRYVENPIRFNPRVRGRRVVVLAGICVAAPIAASVTLLGVQRSLSTTPVMQRWAQARALHADVLRGCDNTTPFGARTDDRCTWRAAGALGEVVLIGDSAAGQLTEPVAAAANRAGYDMTVSTLSGCPFVYVRIDQGSRSDACRTYTVESLRGLERARPSLVVVAARTDLYVESTTGNSLAPMERGAFATEPDAKGRVWQQGLEVVLRRLGAAGVPVLVVHPVPHLPLPLDECAVLRVLTRTCTGTRLRTAVREELRRSFDVEAAAVAAVPPVRAIDLANDLCGGTRCSSVRGGVALYRDGDHLSVEGALTLTDTFFREIAAEARPHQ